MALRRQRHPLIRKGWVRALLLFVIYVAGSVLTGVLVSIYFMAGGESSSKEPVRPDSISTAFSLSFIGISCVLSVVAVFLCRKYIDRRSFASLGLHPRQFFPDGPVGFLMGLFLVATGGLFIYWFNGLQWVNISFDGVDFLSSAALLVLVAISEELVFRGYILRHLRKSFNQWIALVISASLFALVHLTNPGIPLTGIINIFFGGLLLGLSYMYTRNLWNPILFHFSWNFFQGPVLGFPVSGLPFGSVLTAEETPNVLLNGGNFGFEGSVVCSLLLLLACIGFVWLYFNKAKAIWRS